MPIDDFDYPPIPSILADADLAGRPVVLVTSNGTRAIDRVRDHGTLFVASTINAGAVAALLAERNREVRLIAAGRGGSPTPRISPGSTSSSPHSRTAGRMRSSMKPWKRYEARRPPSGSPPLASIGTSRPCCPSIRVQSCRGSRTAGSFNNNMNATGYDAQHLSVLLANLGRMLECEAQ
ncbi:MAG: 2-phosphosulfolactate phosphatase [Natrialbaceae archaeon]|nr:2-phosphosulfolactate phosphatase [Natrialbaceae archaeon]